MGSFEIMTASARLLNLRGGSTGHWYVTFSLPRWSCCIRPVRQADVAVLSKDETACRNCEAKDVCEKE